MSDAPDKWIIINGMGGYVCSACGEPVESEPCREHQPEAYDRYSPAVQRVPVSAFERVEGCWACTNPRGVPIPLTEFPDGDDIGLCTRHWNVWVTRWLGTDDNPPCSAHLLASEIERERKLTSEGRES